MKLLRSFLKVKILWRASSIAAGFAPSHFRQFHRSLNASAFYRHFHQFVYHQHIYFFQAVMYPFMIGAFTLVEVCSAVVSTKRKSQFSFGFIAICYVKFISAVGEGILTFKSSPAV
jgi:hypothetical protein